MATGNLLDPFSVVHYLRERAMGRRASFEPGYRAEVIVHWEEMPPLSLRAYSSHATIARRLLSLSTMIQIERLFLLYLSLGSRGRSLPALAGAIGVKTAH
jgi:hypothetical protein